MNDDGFDLETEQQEDPLGRSQLVMRNRPTLHWEDQTGPRKLVVEGRKTLGSAERADVRIEGRSVSRLHAELELRDDGLWVRDLGSKNGTFVSEILVSLARVPDGAVITLGGVPVSVRYADAPTPVELWREAAFGGLVGRSVVMRELFQTLSRVAPLPEPVLIEGETGTGKEVVARAIHEASPRAGQPFVIVDCGAMPEDLMDAELFGHARGAFTGAMDAREGSVEAADGGTVFLDEIGELPLAMQPKLLRLIESKTYRRVGDTAHRTADVRFLAATHRNLGEMVNDGSFREDLFFRLNVFPITVPPLRARREDIPLLVERFLPRGQRRAIAPTLMHELMGRAWRGNVRELRNFVGRALALGADAALEMLPRDPGGATQPGEAARGLTLADGRAVAVAEFERRYISELLVRHDGNVAESAQEAGVDRTHLHKLIRKYAL